jgi:hypothetical protein
VQVHPGSQAPGTASSLHIMHKGAESGRCSRIVGRRPGERCPFKLKSRPEVLHTKYERKILRSGIWRRLKIVAHFKDYLWPIDQALPGLQGVY